MDMSHSHAFFMADSIAHPRPKVIGYTRVSTGRQAKKQTSHADQAEAIRSHALEHRQTLISVVKDTGSASKLPLRERPKLVAALQQAVASGAFILVAEVDRLVRSVEVMHDILDYDVPIHVVGEGRVRRDELLRRAVEAQEFSERRSREQRAAAAQRKSAGHVSHKCNIPLGDRQRGRDANKARREQNVVHVVDAVLRHPDRFTGTLHSKADALNELGVLNQYTKGTFRLWTREALKKLWPEVAALAGLRRAPDAERGSRSAAPAIPKKEGEDESPAQETVSRVLTDFEKNELKRIMELACLSHSDVMDALGIKRLDVSLWMGVRYGRRVRPALLDALVSFLKRNKDIPPRTKAYLPPRT